MSACGCVEWGTTVHQNLHHSHVPIGACLGGIVRHHGQWTHRHDDGAECNCQEGPCGQASFMAEPHRRGQGLASVRAVLPSDVSQQMSALSEHNVPVTCQARNLPLPGSHVLVTTLSCSNSLGTLTFSRASHAFHIQTNMYTHLSCDASTEPHAAAAMRGVSPFTCDRLLKTAVTTQCRPHVMGP